MWWVKAHHLHSHRTKKYKIMEQIKKFIDDNFETFIKLDDSEVQTFTLDEIDINVVEYLKSIPLTPYFYRDICVYYVERENNIWVENTTL